MSTQLYQQIREFYDASSQLWEEIWGEHMHHGFYGEDGNYQLDRRQAQIELIEEILKWSGDFSKNPPQAIVDVGCGIGGSSLYLAQKFGAQVTGITLSPVQAQRAQARVRSANLADRCDFKVANALEMPFADRSFDLVWSLESGEHMPDKVKFIQECYRVLKPGGKLILVTWCHRSTATAPLNSEEEKLLQDIYRIYCLPYVLSLPQYIEIVSDCGFKYLRSDDWSNAVAPFWDVVIDSAISWRALLGLLRSGWRTIEAALALRLMREGYRSGTIRFGLIAGTK